MMLDNLLKAHKKIGVSACLAGEICRYNGEYSGDKTIEKLVTTGKIFPFCPEVLSELPTPREPAEIRHGDGIDVWQNESKVVTLQGLDVTDKFKNGALNALKLLKNQKISVVILKENSPSCGSHTIYDGTFSGAKKKGIGVAAALFLENEITVYSSSAIALIP